MRCSGVGGYVPGIIVAAGFAPQFILIFRERSTIGLSRWFCTFDVIGSSVSLAALSISDEDLSESEKGASMAPYFAICGCQATLFALTFIVGSRQEPTASARKSSATDEEDPKKLDLVADSDNGADGSNGMNSHIAIGSNGTNGDDVETPSPSETLVRK